jgi:hypothetical protein
LSEVKVGKKISLSPVFFLLLRQPSLRYHNHHISTVIAATNHMLVFSTPPGTPLATPLF